MNIKNLLDFLIELKNNNNREWFNKNKDRYEKLKSEFYVLIQILINKISEFDSDIAGIQPQNCIFRIYRDIRFSADKTPYKINFGGYISKGGKKLDRAGYYIHFEPGYCFLSGGIYMPSMDILRKIRQEIYYNIEEFLEIIQNKNFVKYFNTIDGEKLKKLPRGYPDDFPYSDFLKYKSYNLLYELSENDIYNKNFLENAVRIFEIMYPFNKFINNAIEG